MLTNLTISYPDFKISEVIEPDHFDTNNADIKKKIDAIIAVLNQLTDATTSGASGADAISLTAIAPYTSTKLQAFLNEVIAKLKSTGGSAEIGTPSISGVTGTTVSAQLTSLKSLLDGHATRLTTAETNITNLTTRATNVENRATSLESRATSVEARATNLESGKADKSTTYTRTDVDNKLATKTDLTGDHKGTWFGLTPGQAAEPINGARLDVLEAQNVQSVTLNNGQNTIENVVQEAPLKVLSTKGKTVVNFVPSFNAWNKSAALTVNSDFKATLTVSDSTRNSSGIRIPSSAGKTYTIGGIKSGTTGGRIFADFYDASNTWIGSTLESTFTTPANTVSTEVAIDNGSPALNGTFVFENIILVEGSTAQPHVANIKGIVNPTIEANGKRETIETTLHALNGVQDEIFRDTDGKLKKKTRFKEMALDGSLTYAFSSDSVGFKTIQYSIAGQVSSSSVLSKYDGKIIKALAGTNPTAYDEQVLYSDRLYISIADTDSGWGETYTPTADEIKAYFYGWKMYTWLGDVNTPYSTGTKAWAKRGSDGALSDGQEALPVTSHDKGFIPYKLVYQLATERIEEVATSGQVVLEEGSNTVELKQGVIVKERANPSKGGFASYRLNYNDPSETRLKYKASKIIKIYKNNIDDTANWTIYENNTGGALYGTAGADTPQIDPTATYYVTYEILPELTVKAEPMQVEYASSLKSLVESNTRQISEHEGRLDGLHTVFAKRAIQHFPMIMKEGWTRFNTQFSAPSYSKDDMNIVRLRGMVKGGTLSAGTVIATLPYGFRPTEELYFTSSTGSVDAVKVSTIGVKVNGDIYLGDPAYDQWLSLNGISFPIN